MTTCRLEWGARQSESFFLPPRRELLGWKQVKRSFGLPGRRRVAGKPAVTHSSSLFFFEKKGAKKTCESDSEILNDVSATNTSGIVFYSFYKIRFFLIFNLIFILYMALITTG